MGYAVHRLTTLWLILCHLCLGSPYEMGYAHGQLMQERAKSMMDDVWNYLEDQVVCTVLHNYDKE